MSIIKERGHSRTDRSLNVMRSSTFVVLGLLIISLCVVSIGCRQDMQDQPRYEEYEAGDQRFFTDGKASRQLIEGTIARMPRGQTYIDRQTEYLFTGRMPDSGAGAGAAGTQTGTQGVRANLPGLDRSANATATVQGGPDVFPFGITEDAIRRGQERYNIYCAICHGMTGDADGMIVRRGFRKPPSFHEDRLQENAASASHFFDVVSNGWGAMPSYADTISAEDRWKIIAYVRALQLSRKLKLEDIPADVRVRIESGQQPAATPHSQGH